jgi:hypothetical protein
MNFLPLLLVGAAILPGEGGSADLAVTQDARDVGVYYGRGNDDYSPARYTISVTDNGPDTAFASHATITPSASVRSVTPSAGTCTGTAPIECDLGDIANGQSVTIELETLPADHTQLENKVTVRSGTPDPNPGNDSSTVKSSIVVVDTAPPPPPPDRAPADSDITSPHHGTTRRAPVTELRGRASDDKSGVKTVEIALRRKGGKTCAWLSGKRATFTSRPMAAGRCAEPVWLKASGTTRWTYELSRKLPKGTYVLISRATDGEGKAEASFSVNDRNLVQFKVR